MANHSEKPDNYQNVERTFAEAMEGSEGTAKAASKDTSKKGGAAKNGGGE